MDLNLKYDYKTIDNEAAPFYCQDLTFNKLFMYYAFKSIKLNPDTFEKELNLRTANGEYNIMAYILSDQNEIPIRVSIFNGVDKSSPLVSVKEFGNSCILYSIEKIIEYGDVLNLFQIFKENEGIDKSNVSLFDFEMYKDAIINAFINNNWLTLNAPQISVFTNRIEILSHGGLSMDYTKCNCCECPKINARLCSLLLNVKLIENLNTNYNKIIDRYGDGVVNISLNRVVITIPFENNWTENKNTNPCYHDVILHKTKKIIINNLIKNPFMTIKEMQVITGLSMPGIKKNIKQLKEMQIIERVGSNASGYWKVLI